MSKKTKYIYNKNGNIPFTDKDKKNLPQNIKEAITFENKTYKKYSNNTLINISSKKAEYKELFNGADYVSVEDIKN